MAAQVLIDLSLSTDDEGPAEPLPNDKKPDASAAKANHDFMYLSDGVDGIDDGGSLTENPSKKRKLSSLPAHGVIKAASSTRFSTRRPQSPKWARSIAQVSGRQEGFTLSDDITFTSSADLNHAIVHASRASPNEGNGDDPDDSLPEDILSAARSNLATSVSDRTAALLAKLKGPPASKKSSGSKTTIAPKAPSKSTSRSPKARQDRVADIVSSEEVEESRPKTMKKPKLTEEEKAMKAQEREEAKVKKATQKAKDKDEEKERKRIQREEKAREKQRAADLTEVNKAKKDKKETSKEMIIDLPMSIEGQRVDDQIQEFLRNLGIESNTYQSPVSNVIRWRRKVDSHFDEEKGYRVAMPKEIQDEKHVLCLMSAKEFIELATADSSHVDRETLEEHIGKLKTNFEGCTLIYLIEGFNAWMRKNRNLRNREYQAAVLNQAQNENPSAPSAGQQAPRRKKAAEVYVDEDFIEDALLRLQVMNNCLIHHTATPFESAEWVANFTQHISLIPYR